MKRLNRENTSLTEKLPIKVVQFGEGNFIRAFVDYVIDKLNKETDFRAGVAVIQPRAGGIVRKLKDQDGLFNLFLKGVKNGEELQQKELISCIQRGIDPYTDYESYLKLAEEEELQFLFSNTTEAGIAFDENDTLNGHPHQSFPAKVIALLYRRYQYFSGNPERGLTILPCELIINNADTLKEIIIKYASLWNLEDGFVKWVHESNSFHNTLVDRIVPGYPKDEVETYQSELKFEDKMMVSSEMFFLWAIEGGMELLSKIPFDQIDDNILVVEDLEPYRTRKVRILNGAHTTMVPFSILYGNETVKETIDNEFTGEFIKTAVFKEINKTLDLSEEELNSFAAEVFDRFRNPFIKHQLASIALNSISKFKVRVLPSLLEYQEKYNELPMHLSFAFACLIRFYKGEWKGKSLPVQDDFEIKAFFEDLWKEKNYHKISAKVLQKTSFWDRDLTQITGLQKQIALALEKIDGEGIEEGFFAFSGKLKVL